jgi:chromosome segregation ATPase
VNAANNINQLLELNDAAFVEGAYQALLGRAADLEGMHYYLGRLRAGYDKTAIVAQIAMSAEMRPTERKSPALQEAIASTKNARHWLKGIFSRNDRIERQVHRIENELGRKLDQLLAQQAIASAHFERIQTSLTRQKADVDAQLSTARQHHTELQSITTNRLDSIHYGLVAQKSDVAVHLDRVRQGLVEVQSNATASQHQVEHGLIELKSGAESQLNRIELELAAIRESFQKLASSLKTKSEQPASPLAQLVASNGSGLSLRARRMLSGMAQAAARSTFRGGV